MNYFEFKPGDKVKLSTLVCEEDTVLANSSSEELPAIVRSIYPGGAIELDVFDDHDHFQGKAYAHPCQLELIKMGSERVDEINKNLSGENKTMNFCEALQAMRDHKKIKHPGLLGNEYYMGYWASFPGSEEIDEKQKVKWWDIIKMNGSFAHPDTLRIPLFFLSRDILREDWEIVND